jgi:hypothetical protein
MTSKDSATRPFSAASMTARILQVDRGADLVDRHSGRFAQSAQRAADLGPGATLGRCRQQGVHGPPGRGHWLALAQRERRIRRRRAALRAVASPAAPTSSIVWP